MKFFEWFQPKKTSHGIDPASRMYDGMPDTSLKERIAPYTTKESAPLPAANRLDTLLLPLFAQSDAPTFTYKGDTIEVNLGFIDIPGARSEGAIIITHSDKKTGNALSKIALTKEAGLDDSSRNIYTTHVLTNKGEYTAVAEPKPNEFTEILQEYLSEQNNSSNT